MGAMCPWRDTVDVAKFLDRSAGIFEESGRLIVLSSTSEYDCTQKSIELRELIAVLSRNHMRLTNVRSAAFLSLDKGRDSADAFLQTVSGAIERVQDMLSGSKAYREILAEDMIAPELVVIEVERAINEVKRILHRKESED